MVLVVKTQVNDCSTYRFDANSQANMTRLNCCKTCRLAMLHSRGQVLMGLADFVIVFGVQLPEVFVQAHFAKHVPRR
jgi:hypothetical protein